VSDAGGDYASAGEELRFAVSVAAFGMLLRRSAHAGAASLEDVLRWANESRGDDPGGYRQEFVGLVRKALAIDGR
jgi:Ca-activated chloride channel homolog